LKTNSFTKLAHYECVTRERAMKLTLMRCDATRESAHHTQSILLDYDRLHGQNRSTWVTQLSPRQGRTQGGGSWG